MQKLVSLAWVNSLYSWSVLFQLVFVFSFILFFVCTRFSFFVHLGILKSKSIEEGLFFQSFYCDVNLLARHKIGIKRGSPRVAHMVEVSFSESEGSLIKNQLALSQSQLSCKPNLAARLTRDGGNHQFRVVEAVPLKIVQNWPCGSQVAYF